MTLRRRPLFRDRNAGVLVGLALLGAGCYVLYDAYEGRGGRTPLLLRPLVPF